jgi:hypothetical protein
MALLRRCEVCRRLTYHEWVYDEYDPSRDGPFGDLTSWPMIWRCPSCLKKFDDRRRIGTGHNRPTAGEPMELDRLQGL